MFGLEYDLTQSAQDYYDDPGFIAACEEACRQEGHAWCTVLFGLLEDGGSARYCQRCGVKAPEGDQP